MNEEALRKQLELKQRELGLFLAIDYIRDTIPEPSLMMPALVSTLTEHIHTDLCLICLVDQETQELALKAINDQSGRFGDIHQEALRELNERTSNVQDIFLWEGEAVPHRLRIHHSSDSLSVAVIPIFLQGKRLGFLLFARIDSAFDADDVGLIKLAESQIDSAVIQSYEYYALQQRNKELETIYRIDSIRDRHLPFDEMLNTVLGEVQKVIQAEAGFIMLYSQTEDLLEIRATTHDDLFPFTSYYENINRIATESLKKPGMVWYNDLGTEFRSIMCLPLILGDRIIGVLGVINRYDRHGFDYEDRHLLHAIASQMDTAIFESLKQRHLREVLGRSVDPHVMERLLSLTDTDILNCERSVLSVLYADIRGSTALAEHTEPELLLGFINDYLGHMTDVLLSHEGTLDKFVGDEVMALFGAPFPQPDHAQRAIHVAFDMQQEHQKVMDIWEKQGVRRCPIGIGIATGELIVGEVGCKKRADYTVIGRAANLGARLCSVAKGGEIIISQETYELVKNTVAAKPISGIKMKGIPEGITIYQILNDNVEISSL